MPPECRDLCTGCPERDHWYGRFDEAVPPIQLAVSHFLSSIPSNLRYPRDLQKWQAHFADPKNSRYNRTYLTEYNPSIIRIPPDQISQQYRNSSAVYLASFRVTTLNSCLPTDEIRLNAVGVYDGNATNYKLPEEESYTALALLREDLSIVAEAVFSFQMVYAVRDARLFVLDNQMYISPGNLLYAIRLKPPSTNQTHKQLNPIFQSTTWKDPVYLGRYFSLATRGLGDKNIQFFQDPWDGKIVAEIYPGQHKTVVNVSASYYKSILEPREVNLTITGKRSFGTVDELHFWKKGVSLYNVLTGERGSACCMNVQHKGQDLLLGVSHSKFRFRREETRHSLPGDVSANHYFSSFYAMEAQPPYSVVATSGKFCLGFGDDLEVQENPYARATIHDKLRLGDDTFDCPAIHFISGMTDTPDGEHVIIAYGVADCSPRMIKIRNDDILRMLFPYEGTA